MRSDRERLEDILEAIERIEKYTAKGRAAFEKDELVQMWVVHHLQIIGEACRKLSESLRTRNPELPWAEIIAMRNILVHDYFGIDTEEVWMAVERDVPSFRDKIRKILEKLK